MIEFSNRLLTEIAQSGTIPATAQSIQFDAFAAAFVVTFAGHEIPLTEIGGSYSTNFVYGGDVSAYAGQFGELRFLGTGYLDDIQFSNQPIPEPGVFGLSALCAVLVGWRVLWRPRSQRMPNFCCSECAGRVSVSIRSPRRRIAERFRSAAPQ